MNKFLLNYVHLTAVVVLEFRQWLALLFSLTVFLNVGMIFAFSFIAGSRDPGLGQYIVPGSAIMSLVTIGVSMVANDLAQQRRSGSILYYASLPISKMAYVLAMVSLKDVYVELVGRRIGDIEAGEGGDENAGRPTTAAVLA